MKAREIMPARRRSESFELPFGGFLTPHKITMGYYSDGRLGEVFITSGKTGEMVEAIARDGAILLSIALQHGATLDTIKSAITRDSQGSPTSIVGAVVDKL